MGQIKFVGNLIMLVVFTMSVVLFSVGFALDNRTSIILTNDSNYEGLTGDIEGSLGQWRTDVINSSNSLYQSEISEGETVRTSGPFTLGPYTALNTSRVLLGASFNSVFGGGTEFGWLFTTLATFLGFMLGLLIWKTWAGRNPE